MRPPTIGFPALVQEFFVKRLVAQCAASAETVSSYRDAFELLLRYAAQATRKAPSALSFDDLDAPMVLAFLDHLERDRGNTPRTRNLRLAAIRSFMRYASVRAPATLPVAQRVLAIPVKRFDRPILGFLTRDEIKAVLAAPDPATWSGRRDRALFSMLYNTGARVSEAIAVRVRDVVLDREASILLHGKGRKERTVPLWRSTVSILRAWVGEIDRGLDAPFFPNRDGKRMSRSGVEDRLGLALATATKECPALAGRRVSPHTIRHTTAMHFLQSGVDITVIALWLGHASPVTTHHYVEADIEMKEAALGRVADPGTKPARFRAGDRLLEFLRGL